MSLSRPAKPLRPYLRTTRVVDRRADLGCKVSLFQRRVDHIMQCWSCSTIQPSIQDPPTFSKSLHVGPKALGETRLIESRAENLRLQVAFGCEFWGLWSWGYLQSANLRISHCTTAASTESRRQACGTPIALRVQRCPTFQQ